MSFDGTVEWVLAHAAEARDLIESQRDLLRAYHVRLGQAQAAPRTPAKPPIPQRIAVPATAPWWKVWG